MAAKVKVYIVQPAEKTGLGDSRIRLIRGTLKEVEAKLRQEVSIEPCSAEEAHKLADVEIEEAQA